MMAFKSVWDNWEPKTPNQQTYKADKSPSVSSVSASPGGILDSNSEKELSESLTSLTDKADKSLDPQSSTFGICPALSEPEPGPGAEAQAWRNWYKQRCVIRNFERGYPPEMAEALAYGEAINRWHKLYGQRQDPALCAGCGELLSGAEVLILPGSSRVHIDDEWSCLRAYGKRWRAQAVRALAEVGITPPAQWQG